MQQTTWQLPVEAVLRPPAQRPFGLLILDADPVIHQIAQATLGGSRRRLLEARTYAQALKIVQREPVDLILVGPSLPDGDGLNLVRRLSRKDPDLEAVLIVDEIETDRVVASLRCGVREVLDRPIEPAELRMCVNTALQRRQRRSRLQARHRRLKGLCRKINIDRRQARRQLQNLSADLVNAYQDLADRFNHTQAITRFEQVIQNEDTLDGLLRAVLNYIVELTGSTNGVIFLPTATGRYTASAYINDSYEQLATAPLLRTLARLAAPRIALAQQTFVLGNEEEVFGWLEHRVPELEGLGVLAFPLEAEDEVLGSVMLFRDDREVFEDRFVGVFDQIAPMFAERLVQLIRRHQERAATHDSSAADLGSLEDLGPSGGHRPRFEI